MAFADRRPSVSEPVSSSPLTETTGPRVETPTPHAALFLRKFLTKGVSVASVAPSSRHLAALAAAPVDPDTPQAIVELGAGTGAVTAEIVRRMHPESRLLAVELDADFADVVRRRFPSARVVTGSAAELSSHLAEAGLERVDVFVNCLPTPSLPKPVVEAVMRAFVERRSSPETPMTQISVMPWVYRGFYRRMFREATFRLVLKNVPPGGVYLCRGLNDAYRRKLGLAGPN